MCVPCLETPDHNQPTVAAILKDCGASWTKAEDGWWQTPINRSLKLLVRSRATSKWFEDEDNTIIFILIYSF